MPLWRRDSLKTRTNGGTPLASSFWGYYIGRQFGLSQSRSRLTLRSRNWAACTTGQDVDRPPLRTTNVVIVVPFKQSSAHQSRNRRLTSVLMASMADVYCVTFSKASPISCAAFSTFSSSKWA